MVSKSSVAVKSAAPDPTGRERVLRLVVEHKKRTYEPLHLALQFPHPRHKRDVCLFEIIGGFGGEQLDPDRKIFEVQFAPNPRFPMPNDRPLRLFLTSPTEFREATRKGWRTLNLVREAVRKGDADILFKDKIGAPLLELLR